MGISLPKHCDAALLTLAAPERSLRAHALPHSVLVKKSVNQTTIHINRANLERGRRIELLALAWKAKVLPLYEPRTTPERFFFAGGEGWIRTSVLVRGQIYSLLPLTTRPPLL